MAQQIKIEPEPKSVDDILKKAKQNSKDLPPMPVIKLTFGQRAADKVAKFAGSWKFIIIMTTFIFTWIALNMIGWGLQWDPWPFILLNLAFSLLAAYQAPIILMSQNRQAERDRQSQRYDYLINRKAERENQEIIKLIKSIKYKLDKLEKKTK